MATDDGGQCGMEGLNGLCVCTCVCTFASTFYTIGATVHRAAQDVWIFTAVRCGLLVLVAHPARQPRCFWVGFDARASRRGGGTAVAESW